MEDPLGGVALAELQCLGIPLGDMPAHRSDPAALRQDHRDRLLLDHLAPVDLAMRRRHLADPRPPFVAEFVAHRRKVALEPIALLDRALDQRRQLGALLDQPAALLGDLHLLELAQAAQPHVEDCLGLPVAQRKLFDHHRLGLVLGADDLDHAVEVQKRDQKPVEQFQPLVDLADPRAASAQQHLDLERQPREQRLAEAQHARRAVLVEHVEVKREAHLQLGHLVQTLLEQPRIDGARPRLEDDPQILRALVAHIGQDRQFLVADQPRDRLDQPPLLHPVGDLGHQQMPAPALLDHLLDPRAKAERPPPGRIGCRDRLARIDQHAAGRKVRPADKVEQRPVLGLRIVDQMHRGIGQFGEVVRRDRGRHPHRNPARAIGEQIGEQPGEHLGLLILAIVGRAILDRPLVEPGHQLRRHPRQPRLGVAVGGGIIPVDIPEIPLPVDQRITQRPILRQPDHRVIHRLVAMRMIFADHIANHASGFLVGGSRIEPQQPHRPQQAAMDGF